MSGANKQVKKKAVVKRPAERVVPMCGHSFDRNPSIDPDYSKKKLFTKADLDNARREAIPEPTTYDKFNDLKRVIHSQQREVLSARERFEFETRVLAQQQTQLKVLAEELKFEAVASL